jgi:hypothetical protein
MRSHVHEHDLARLQGSQHPIDDLFHRLPGPAVPVPVADTFGLWQ